VKKMALTLALLLSSCGEFLDVCHSCLGGDPTKPVAAGDVAKIGLVYSGRKLPASASNIYYHELCGIDCQQWIRFDAPEADARDFAENLLVRPLSKGWAKDMLRTGWGPNDIKGDSAKFMPWWPNQFSSGIETGENTLNDADKGQPMRIVITGDGKIARVWLAAYTT
jgi:hypothetical protein